MKAKRGPGRPRGRAPTEPRVGITPAQHASLLALPGGTVPEHVRRAVAAYLDEGDSIEAVAAANHQAGRAWMAAAVRRMLEVGPRWTVTVDTQRIGADGGIEVATGPASPSRS